MWRLTPTPQMNHHDAAIQSKEKDRGKTHWATGERQFSRFGGWGCYPGTLSANVVEFLSLSGRFSQTTALHSLALGWWTFTIRGRTVGWPQNVALRQKYLQRSVHNRNLLCGMRWGMPPLIMECVRGKSSSSALLVICSRCYQMKLRWGMSPQATKSVWHKKSSSSLSRINVNTLPNGYVDKCYLLPWNVSKARVAPAHCCNYCQHVTYWNALGKATSCHFKSEAKVAPAQFWVLLLKQLWLRLGNTLSGHGMCPKLKWLQRNIVLAAETLPDSGTLESTASDHELCPSLG